MPIKFKPMPWLTLFTLICLGILIWLGTWQYQRLQWKTNLLVEIDQAAEAAPIANAQDLEKLFQTKSPLDFRRVGLNGSFISPDSNEGAPFHLMMSDGKSMLWHLVQPFQTDSGTVFVVTKNFPHQQKQTPAKALQGEQSITGYVRLVRETSMQPKSKPENNEWYVFNGTPEVLDWARAVSGQTIPVGYYIDQVADIESASDLAVKKPELRNNHLDYMLTWYSFAFILIVIYFILHRRQGRLQFGNKNA